MVKDLTEKMGQNEKYKSLMMISNHTTQNQANYLIYMNIVISHVRNEISINLNILSYLSRETYKN